MDRLLWRMTSPLSCTILPFHIYHDTDTVLPYTQRAIGHTESPDWSIGAFVLQSVLILVAPALFAASIYMELGRIIRMTDGASHSMVPLRWLTKIFVAGDVLSFLMQSSGQSFHILWLRLML